MYKILVVDDEKLAREDIVYKISSSGLPITWLMEAESGEEALQIVKANYPDIMITDIMMVEMSGLDLIRETNRIAPQMISIIICGYPDFSFAQQAVELGAANYLLKPVKPAELAAVLSEAERRLRRRRENRRLSTANYALNKRLQEFALRERINAFLNVGLPQDTDDLSELLPDDSAWYQLWDICLIDSEVRYSGHKGSEAGLLYGVCNIIDELGKIDESGEPLGSYLLPVEKLGGRLAVVTLAASRQKDSAAAAQELASYVQKAKTAVEKSLGVLMFIGISRVSSMLSSANVLEARKALDVRLYYGNSSGRILDYTRLAVETEDKFLENDISLFKKVVAEGQTEQAVNMVEVLISKYTERPLLGIRDVYIELIHKLSRSSYKKGVSILKFLGAENISGAVIDQFETMEELIENLKSIINITLGSWVKYQESTADVLTRVRQYIDGHFTESVLCTNELAGIFCISVGYLSAAYKKYIGTTITKYITGKRMEYAAKLLTETDIPIGQISDACGFNNLSYFMKVFKTHYKITPAQYRNREML